MKTQKLGSRLHPDNATITPSPFSLHHRHIEDRFSDSRKESAKVGTNVQLTVLSVPAQHGAWIGCDAKHHVAKVGSFGQGEQTVCRRCQYVDR